MAEGFTQEAVARAGSTLSDSTLAILQSQLEGLDFVVEFVRGQRDFTKAFIRELQALLTRTQEFYDATDALGRRTRVALDHGGFKRLPNNVAREDGSVLQFAPPEHVERELERLIEMYDELPESIHPVVAAAWLHHRFVQIHPFQDGNGRVARALTLLALEKGRFPPVVIDRDSRLHYLTALDDANYGDLVPLAKLFIQLAVRSIRRELELPVALEPAPTTAKDVARAFARQLRRAKEDEGAEKARALHPRATELHARVTRWLEKAGSEIADAFEEEGVRVATRVFEAGPGNPQEKWWRNQIVQSARRADHYADLKADTWWSHLRLILERERTKLNFVVSLHHVGSPLTGVMTAVTFAELRGLESEESDQGHLPIETPSDAFTFTYTEDVTTRVADLETWLDESLTLALDGLRRGGA